MAYIKTLKDNELIGGTDNTDVYPVSTTQAIYSQKPDGTVPEGIKHQRLEERLEDHEEDAQELHRKVEKLVVYLDNNKGGQTLEITGSASVATLTGSANIETFGDESDAHILPADMTVKELSVTYSSASTTIAGHADGYNWVGSYTLPNVVGTYTFKFRCGYDNGTPKEETSSTYVNLRKYFGFADSQPTTVEDLIALVSQEKAVSHFSNSVGCTVTIPANGTGFKRIYLAVPNGMSITRVVQPDALNAPLVLANQNNPAIINRTIGGATYTYKLYWSADLIDSSVSKRLTIS